MMSYTSLIGFMSNGINVIAFPVATILLIVAFVYPLFGKKSYYCTHVCPYGSLQELVGRCVGFKVKMKATTVHRLNIVRQLLWAVLMVCLWSGAWFGWIDDEPFSAFIVESGFVGRHRHSRSVYPALNSSHAPLLPLRLPDGNTV